MPFPSIARVARALPVLLVALFAALAGATRVCALDPHRVIDAYGHDSWTRQNSLPGEAVYQVAQTRDGYLWLRISDRLVRFDGVNFHPLEADLPDMADEPVRAICLTAEGDLLVRGREHLLRYHEGRFADARPKAPLPDAMDRLVYETRDDRLWVGADNHLYVAKDHGFAYVIRGSSWINAMTEDRAGDLWIGAYTGLYRYRDGSFTIFPSDLFSERVATTPPPGALPAANPPPAPTVSAAKVKQVLALLEDREGTLWVGTHNDGLYKFIDGHLVADATTAPLAKQSITALAQDRDGNLWVGTDTSGVFRLAGGKWSSFTVEDGLKDNSVLSLCEDREGSLWIGTRGGLDRFRDTPIVTYTAKQGLSSDEAYTIVEGADHCIYVVTSAGLNRLKDGVITRYT